MSPIRAVAAPMQLSAAIDSASSWAPRSSGALVEINCLSVSTCELQYRLLFDSPRGSGRGQLENLVPVRQEGRHLALVSRVQLVKDSIDRRPEVRNFVVRPVRQGLT